MRALDVPSGKTRRLLGLLMALTVLGMGLPMAGSEGQGQTLQATLVGYSGFFGSEAWKYNPDYVRNGFDSSEDVVAHAENESSSYFSAMGYRVRLELQIVEQSTGNPIGSDDPNIGITAFIETPNGRLRPFKIDNGSGQFTLDFDVDGSSAGGPGGNPTPALAPGAHQVQVEIFEDGGPGGPDFPRGKNTLTFVYERPSVTINYPTPRPAQVMLPDNMFRLYNDLGYGPSVLALDTVVGLDETLSATYTFPGSPNASVQFTGFMASRSTPGSGTSPFVPGVTDDPAVGGALSQSNSLVTVQSFAIANGTTDATGTVTFEINPANITGVAALTLFAVTLDEEPIPSGQILGGSGVVLGAGEFLVPVVATPQVQSPAETFSLNYVRAANNPNSDVATVEVRVFDPLGRSPADADASGPSASTAGHVGEAYAYVNRPSGAELLTSTSIKPDTNTARAAKHRVASLPAAPIRAADVSNYRIMSILYYGENDQFYTLTYADRGFRVTGSAPASHIGEMGTLWVNVTSFTTNYDDTPNDGNFALDVTMAVDSPSLGINESKSLVLDEASIQSFSFPVTAAAAGDYEYTVTAETGDIIAPTMTGTVRFTAGPQDKGFFEGVPGPGLAAFIAALAVGLLVRRRR